MEKKEVISIMSRLGFADGRVTSTGETFQIGYWEYPKKNGKGERLVLEVLACYNAENRKSKNCLPVIWHKKKFTKTLILDFWSVRSYVYGEDGCTGKLDFVKLDDGGKRYVIDFDWVLPCDGESLEKMVREMLRRFNS